MIYGNEKKQQNCSILNVTHTYRAFWSVAIHLRRRWRRHRVEFSCYWFVSIKARRRKSRESLLAPQADNRNISYRRLISSIFRTVANLRPSLFPRTFLRMIYLVCLSAAPPTIPSAFAVWPHRRVSNLSKE